MIKSFIPFVKSPEYYALLYAKIHLSSKIYFNCRAGISLNALIPAATNEIPRPSNTRNRRHRL
ncbi:MAG: hypothetical protein ACPGVV_11605, partial [Croceimicrobium sp.]